MIPSIAQTSNLLSAVNLSAGTTSQNLSAMVFSNSNGMSFGLNGSTVTGSYTVPTQTNQSAIRGLGVSNTGQTAGNTGLSTGIDWVLAGSQSITLSQSTAGGGPNTIWVQHPAWLTTAMQSNAATISNINVSAGTTSNNLSALTFNNANGVSFGLNGSTITASVAAAGGAQTGISGIVVSDATYTSGTVSFSNVANITISSSVNGATQYIRLSGNAAQTNQSAIRGLGVSNTGQTAGNTGISTGIDWVLAGSNSITLSQSTAGGGPNTIWVQHPAWLTTAMQSNAVTLSNIRVSAGTTSNLLSAITFSNANGISFGLDASTVTASYTVPTQTNQTLGGYFVGNTTGQSSSSTFDARTLSIDGAGIVSAGWSAGSMRISATQSNQAFSAAGGSSAFQTLGFSDNAYGSFTNTNGSVAIASIRASIYAVSNTTQSTSNTYNLSALSFHGAGAASVGVSNGSVIVSVPTGGGVNPVASASNGSFSFTTLNFSNANNVTFGTSAGSIITASVAAPGAAAENNWMHALGANTAGNTTASGSTIGLSGINLTISGTNNSVFNLSVPATSSLSATGQVSISTNGSTISIGVPNPTTLSGWNPYPDMPLVTGQYGQASLQIDPQRFANFQFDRVMVPIFNTNSSNSSGSHTISSWVGIYTRNGSSLSRLTSTSTSLALTHSGTAGSYSLYSGFRLVSIPMTSTFTEGEYWIAQVSRTTSGGANGSYSNMVGSALNSNFLGHWSSSHNTTYQLTLGQGVYTATTSGIPQSIAFTEIRGSDSIALRPALIMFASSTV